MVKAALRPPLVAEVAQQDKELVEKCGRHTTRHRHARGGCLYDVCDRFTGRGRRLPTSASISWASREPLGLLLGVSVEGAALTIRDTLNVGYYGAGIRTPLISSGSDDIFVKRDVSNPHAAELRAMLAKTSRKK